MQSYLTTQQLLVCGLRPNHDTGNLSRINRVVARLLDAAIDLGYLELANGRKSCGLYSFERSFIASTLGISQARIIERFRVATDTACYGGVLVRTAKADAEALAYALQSEDAPPADNDPTDVAPLSGIIIGAEELDQLWDQCENMMLADGETLRILDPQRASRRLVRQIVRIAGGDTSVPVKNGHPRRCCYDFIDKRTVGTAAVDHAAAILADRLANDPTHRMPLERFSRICKTVLEALGASVSVDLDALWSSAA
jgi:hypothetical protein